jgi:hypothetical protein
MPGGCVGKEDFGREVCLLEVMRVGLLWMAGMHEWMFESVVVEGVKFCR